MKQMESSVNDADLHTSWTAATTWTIAGGSVANSVTVESSSSEIDYHSDDDRDPSITVDSESKSPLILCPSSTDSSPCEITITFAKKHEVRQIYVRSTARVYEIYYAPELKGGAEYLSTVRCGIAMRDEEVLRINEVEGLLVHPKILVEEKIKNGTGVVTNEDDWVEVKVPGNGSVSNPQTSTQDFFEATAEITDPNPCFVLTLRLLSVQNKGCVCVDEVYVFADPVDAASLDNQVAPVEDSAGSSLMAMLVPAFYQLSRTKAISGSQDKHNIDVCEKRKAEETRSAATDSISTENENHPEVKIQGAAKPTVETVQLQNSIESSDAGSRSHVANGGIEGVLTHLVSRVNGIEDFLLRFEESMLKPIRSIDERLQNVELQLEVLAKKTEKPGLISCTRISAPEFSCSESENNSFYYSEGRDVNNTACETSTKEMPYVPLDATPVSVSATTLHPGLVVTAPEFNYDEEENHSSEPVKESPKGIQKRAMSIDAALGNYLAQFLPSTSVQSPKYSQTLTVKAPEFPNEDENADENAVSPRVCSQVSTDLSLSVSETDGPEPLRSSTSLLHVSGDESTTRTSNEINFAEDHGGDELSLQDVQVEGNLQGASLVLESTPVTNAMTRIDSLHMTDDCIDEEGSSGTSSISSVEQINSLPPFSGNKTDDVSALGDVSNGSGTSTSSEVTKVDSKKDILHNMVELCTTSQVDYETPILDVQFVYQKNPDSPSPLDELFAGTSNSNLQVTSAVGSFDLQRDLIPVNDWEAMDSATDAHLSLDMDYYSARDTPHDTACSSHEISAASLI